MGTNLNKLTSQRWIDTVEAIHLLCDTIFQDNVEVGWWDERTLVRPDDADMRNGRKFGGHQPMPVPDKYLVPTKLALIHSEVSEALEGYRKGLKDDHLPNRSMFEVELADTCIRIFDLAGYLGLDLGGAIMDKLAYNATRADHKREARSAPGGKAV